MPIFKINFSNDNPPINSARFWIKVLIMSISIIITCYISNTASVDNFFDAVLASVIISLLSCFVKPLLTLLSVPLIVFTFGFFNLVINAIIILMTAYFVKGFDVYGFWNAILFSIIITIISFILDLPLRIQRFKQTTGMDFRNKKFNKDDENRVDDTDFEDVTDQDEETK
ncbi:MAG: phage holin family protein [Bacteroidales bacterium]|nr:phage holin family protein [Bacteroidales bacterium]